MSSSIPERTVESWLALELEVWFPGVRLWAPTQSAAGNWDVAAQGAGKLLIFECKGCDPLKQGHRVPINMAQLQRYAMGRDFAAVRDHVFYVLPAPPWLGSSPAPGAPFTPPAALPAEYADQRLVGSAGGCWEWFHVTTAKTLWASLRLTESSSVNTRRLPNSPSLGLREHNLGPLPGTQRLNDFLDDIARCRGVPLTGADNEDGAPPQQGSSENHTGGWRRPDGRGSGGPPIWPGDAEPPEPPDEPGDQRLYDEYGEGSAPTPIAAFVPRHALAEK
jgi:hypothetical protein